MMEQDDGKHMEERGEGTPSEEQLPDVALNPMQMHGCKGSAVARRQSGSVESGSIDVIPDEKEVVAREADPFLTNMNYFIILGLALLQGMINAAYTFPVIIFVQGYGLNLVTCTNITVAGQIFGVYLVILVGKLSDGLKGFKWGRRKPFVFFGMIVAAVASIILAFPVAGSSQAFMATQVAIGYFSLQIGTSFTSLPFQSWLIESIRDEDGYKRLTTLIQMVTLLSLVVNALLGISGQFFIIAVSILVFTIIFVPCLVFFVPNPVLNEAPACPPIIPSIRTCVRTKEFVTILTNNSAILVGLALGQEFMIITWISCYGLVKMQDTQYALAYFGMGVFPCAIGGLVLINYLLTKYDKIYLYQGMTLCAWAGACFLAFTLIPALSSYNGANPSKEMYHTMYIICIVLLSFNTGAVLVPISFVQGLFTRDLVLYDNFVNNIDRENVYQVALATPLNIIANTAGGIFKAIIFSTGFTQFSEKNENDDYITSQYKWNEGTVAQVFAYEIAISTLMCWLGFWVMRSYPLTKNLVEKMSEVVKRRKTKKAAAAETRAAAMEIEKVQGMRGSLQKIDAAEEEQRAFRDEVDLWNYLSRTEVNHICLSPTVNGKNTGLEQVLANNRIGALIFGPASMISLIIGGVMQLMNGGQFGTIVITLFNVAAFYTYYEVSRNFQLGALMQLNEEDLKEQAKAAKQSNDKYSSNVQNLLDINNIKEDDDDDDEGTTTEFRRSIDPAHPNATISHRSRSSSVASMARDTKSSIVQPLAAPSELSGYKRHWAFMSLFILIGILAAVFSN